MGRRWWMALAVCLAALGMAGSAAAQSSIDQVAQALKSDPVFVDGTAERAITAGAADDLRSRIRGGGSPVFVAVLPASAGDASQVALELRRAVGLSGTYAVVAGDSFRAASDALPRGVASRLATSSFQAKSSQGVAEVLFDFVGRVAQAQAALPAGTAAPGTAASPGTTSAASSGGGGGVSGGTIVLLVLVALGGVGLFLWSRKRRRLREEQAREEAAARRQLEAELSVLSEDVVALESEVSLHPEARDDYDAGVARHQAAQAAMGHTGDKVDLVRVGRVIEEGRYAMSRARARIDGREPPPPPPDLTRPGSRNEPALDLDDEGAPRYVGYAGGFYGGGGWFGGGGGLFTGLLLGQMMGGGYGYGYGYGGGYDDRDDDNRDDNDRDDRDGGGDFGGGDWGGDGGGDFGGGDFGGGDF